MKSLIHEQPYLVEGHHHTDDGAQKSERGSHGDEELDPRAALLKVGCLQTTVVGDAALDGVHGLVDMEQSLIAHTGHWASRIATERLGALHIVGLQAPLDILHQLVGLDL